MSKNILPREKAAIEIQEFESSQRRNLLSIEGIQFQSAINSCDESSMKMRKAPELDGSIMRYKVLF